MEKAKEEYSIERDWFGLGLFCSFMALKKNKLLINDYVFRYFALIFCSFYKRKKGLYFLHSLLNLCQRTKYSFSIKQKNDLRRKCK